MVWLSKNEPRRVTPGPQRSIWVTAANSSSQTKYAMLPCSCGVRAVLSVVIAAAVVDGKIVRASMSCAPSLRPARSRSEARKGTSPEAHNARSWPRPRPSARTARRFAVPSLINCRGHLTLDGEASFAAEVRQTDGLAMVKAFKNARASLYAGVTTVRDLGANGTMVIELGRAIERGVVEGPRIVAAGRGVTTTGGHGAEVGRVADGPDEVRKAVREQVRSGARGIKICPTGWVPGEGAPPEVSQFTPEETAAAVAEAHNAGLRITTHAHGSGGMRVAAEASIDSVEHATLLDERTVRLLKERDVAIIPTFAAIHSLLEHANVLDPVVIERTRAVADRHREGVRMAHRAGVRIAAGTDSGTPFNLHERFAVELELLTECGLSAEQALAAATSGSARVVGLEKAGHIGGGCWADLVFVDGDPIADVAVLLSPKTVYVRGAPVV